MIKIFNLFKRKPKPIKPVKTADLDWIRVNGSDELKLILNNYPNSPSLYDSYIKERVRKECPGWRILNRHLDSLEEITVDEYVKPRNVLTVTSQLQKYPNIKFVNEYVCGYLYTQHMILDFLGEILHHD